MHAPETLAFSIRRPWPQRSSLDQRPYYPDMINIWHIDPETDGSDDSCGWFKRARHGDKAVLERIRAEFEFNWDAEFGSWFFPDGRPRLSVSAITLNMFHRAAYEFYGKSWNKAAAFMRRHLSELLLFAENPIDSLDGSITMKYGPQRRDEKIADFASTVYGWILRAEQPWWRHPRWHFWHWQIQIPALQAFKRWAFSRCAGCGRGFPWGYAPISDGWGGNGPRWFRGEPGVRHFDCSSGRPTGYVAQAAPRQP